MARTDPSRGKPVLRLAGQPEQAPGRRWARRWEARNARGAISRPTPPRRHLGGLRLTRRAFALMAIVIVLGLLTVAPLQTYLAERAQVQALQGRHEVLSAALSRLTTQQQQLQTTSHVLALARQELHMIRPGEQAWVLVGAPPAGAAPKPPQPAWYVRAWSTVVHHLP